LFCGRSNSTTVKSCIGLIKTVFVSVKNLRNRYTKKFGQFECPISYLNTIRNKIVHIRNVHDFRGKMTKFD